MGAEQEEAGVIVNLMELMRRAFLSGGRSRAQRPESEPAAKGKGTTERPDNSLPAILPFALS
jgi:hypothetical protein